MLRALTKTQAWLLIAVLVLACVWAARLAPVDVPAPAHANGYSDVQLYHDIVDNMGGGSGYYQAATTLQRQHGFPTSPFVTVRLPTLAVMAATFGWPALQAVLASLLGLAALLWYREAKVGATPLEAAAVALAVIAGGAMVSQGELAAVHELWAGALLAIAMALRGGKHWPLALAAAAAALAIREMTLPFVLLACLFAGVERRRNEAIGWAMVVVLFGVGMALHAQAVHAVALPTDLASEGWRGFRGPSAVLLDLVDVSLLNRLPGPLAYPLTLLALLGWSAAPLRQARFALLYFAGYALMLALFARTQNFYWATVLLPLWFVGFAFLPRAVRELCGAMR
ncbi:MAG: hypothetical protein ABIU18_06930 [Novosphingobium sp.]